MDSKIEVVVAGIGGMYPKSENMDELIDILLQNRVIKERAKWTENNRTDGQTFLNNLTEKRHQRFDSAFFGVHRSQTIYYDPMTRLFMEAAFESIVDAGLNPADLSGRNVPVIYVSSISESNSTLGTPDIPGFGITGQSRCMAANRVSYFLNVTGPSYAMDANWCGGLRGIADGVDMIQRGICDLAIVGGANLSLGPHVHQLMYTRGLVSKDGLTKPFTEQADGYSRCDATVVLVLQRSDTAKRSYASILGADSIFCGLGDKEFKKPNTENFVKFLQELYDKCGVDPKDVSYLEADGCGLKDTDEVEISAAEKIFCKNSDSPLLIGSIKTNIGHAECTSAFMSLIKVIVAMETGIIPAHMNFDLKDTKIPALVDGTIEVVTKNRKWNGDIAAVNNFGLVSNFGHMIVRRNQQQNVSPTTDLPLLTYYSTRTEEGILKLGQMVLTQSADLSYIKLINDTFSNSLAANLYRGYTLKASTQKQFSQNFSGAKPPVWFMYSGMGSQWTTMGRELLKLPAFAKSVHKCHEILKPKGIDLLKIITDDNPDTFENILNSFVGIAAIQIGLTDVLELIGIVPDGMIGHSVGELGCAYADKCLTAEEMILCAYYRGKASLDAKLIVGLMAAVGMGYSAMQKICPDSIDVACHNSAESCTISGPAEDVEKFVEVLKSTGVFAKAVNVANIAYHSQYIKPAAPLLLSSLKKLITHPKQRSSKWISTSVPEKLWDTDLAKSVSPEYLTNNLLSSVLLEECLPFIPPNAVVIEIAPHGLMQAILKRALPKEVVNISLTKRNTNNLEFLFNSFGQLYINGIDFNVSPLYPEVPRPVPRGTKSLTNFVQWEHGDEWFSSAYDAVVGLHVKSFIINSREIFNLKSNKVDNRIIVPFTILFQYIHTVVIEDSKSKVVTFEDILIEHHIEMSADDTTIVSVMYQPGSGRFEVKNKKRIILSGRALMNEPIKLPSANISSDKEIAVINPSSFYKELDVKGYKYPKANRLVSEIIMKQKGYAAKINQTSDIKSLLSSAFQIHLFDKTQSSRQILLPKFIRRLHVSMDDFINNKEDYSLWYNSITNVLEIDGGVHITDIEYEVIESNNTPINVENLKFAAYSDEYKQDTLNGLEMFIKILTENILNENLTITELKDRHGPTYLPYVEKHLEEKGIKAKTSEIFDLDSTNLENSSLTIVSGYFLNIISEVLRNVNSFVLLCFPNSKSISISDKYVTVAQFSTNNNKFYLVKEAGSGPVEVLNIKDQKLSFKNIQKSSAQWTAELKASIKDGKRLFLVFNTLPVEGIREFVDKMQSLAHEKDSLRFLFILDPKAPECKPESEFYARIFKQDLIVQVLKGGTWGNFVDIGLVSEENVHGRLISHAALSRDLLSVCKPNYFGLHLNDLTRTNLENIPCEIGAIDFSGINGKGQQVMGFGQFDPDQCALKTDPEFLWRVPNSWSLSDASTIPYAYTLAYYTLFNIGNITRSDTVLIHAGASEVGLAALAIAIDYGCTVYTTVETEVQRSYIKKQFLKMDDINVIDASKDYAKIISSVTRGLGVEVVLNCLSGVDHFEASKKLLAIYGRFIQLGTYDMGRYNTTGLRIFNDCISFYGISGQQLLQLPHDIKHQLSQMVATGLKNNVIAPMRKKMFTTDKIEEGLRYLRKSKSIGAVVTQLDSEYLEKLNKDKKSIEQKQTKSTYLIYADSSDAWVFTVDWLVKNGAKKIVVANILNQNPEFINRYVKVIRQNYNSEIIISKYNANSVENVKKLLSEVSRLGSLQEIFIFTMSENTSNSKNLVENMDKALHYVQYHGRLLHFMGKNREKSNVQTNGLNICNIAWNSGYTSQDVIKNLDMILEKNSPYIFLNNSVERVGSTGRSTVGDDSWLLSTSLPILKHLSHLEEKIPKIVPLPSNCATNSRDVPPVFIVPNLSGPYCSKLRNFVAQLMQPVFCLSLPAELNKDDIVEVLTKKIISIHSGEPYKLIGFSWGCILALEIAKQLELLGKKTELYLIDGAPEIIKNFTNMFNNNEEFDFSLLKDVVQINRESLQTILSSSDMHKTDHKDIARALTVLKNCIEYSNFYKPLQNVVRGPVVAIVPKTTPEEKLDLSDHCEIFRYELVEEDSGNILESQRIIDYLLETL